MYVICSVCFERDTPSDDKYFFLDLHHILSFHELQARISKRGTRTVS
jgi:hypothetical protein